MIDLPQPRPLDELKTVVEGHVSKVYTATNYNIKRTAEILGISRATLYRYLKRMGIK